MSISTEADQKNNAALQRYYRLHAHIYDATRWSFLFGRHKIIKLAAQYAKPNRILEVGCGTGTNLLHLAKHFPTADITGVDLSSDMLAIANNKIAPQAKRVQVIEQKYDRPLRKDDSNEPADYDMVLFSYALTMFNPGWEDAIQAAYEQLKPGGIIAVVDFHHSRFAGFRRWMRVNHVRMEGHLLPALEQQFKANHNQRCAAYAGLWQYLFFIGSKT